MTEARRVSHNALKPVAMAAVPAFYSPRAGTQRGARHLAQRIQYHAAFPGPPADACRTPI
jgi:hypothetical protein